ncbi:MAG TPA: dTMP kinase [Candidatus Paceibacterota bacterium]|nr:dTMP kinase [Candidatus Paceibacterota bacterium]
MDKRGKFIVIDGMDGSGKGTQIKLLQERLADKGVLFTREPGGSPLGEEIREILLRTEGNSRGPLADLFLFFASRASHVEDTVTPARERGTHVISDRYASSTYAFQAYGEEKRELLPLFDAVMHSLDRAKYWPDLYLILDLPGEMAYERRRKDAAQAKSGFDLKPLAYHERTREGFKAFAKSYGPVEFVDASRSPQEIHADIWNIVAPMVGFK